MNTEFYSRKDFDVVLSSQCALADQIGLLADMARLNVLASVKRAGSGHLGTSFSSLDILATLYWSELSCLKLGMDHPDRDVFLSSKGHDAPAQYAILYAAGVLSEGHFLGLRRLGGTPGHPDVNETPGIEANTGSLGMGISKAKGILHAKRLGRRKGRAFVLTGDGEWQEGQNFEALQSAVVHGMSDLWVVVDHNKVQSDRLVKDTLDLGDLARKVEAFGWYVAHCPGHDVTALMNAFKTAARVDDRPKMIIADTFKGKGVSFMEHPTAMVDGSLYKFHSGAPDDDAYCLAHGELVARIEACRKQFGIVPLTLTIREPHSPIAKPINPEFVTKAYGECLVEIGRERGDVVVLDADLALDCQLLEFQRQFPERFIECGIAEQDMVSTASGLALQGFLPFVHSFGVFLAARANEQIYNQNTEKTKVIYTCNFAGILPAGPGHSHQSLRDIGLFGSLPDVRIVQPANAAQTKSLLRWAVYDAVCSTMIRLIIGPSPRRLAFAGEEQAVLGVGNVLRDGTGIGLVTYGPVMLNEVLKAAEALSSSGIEARVINMPWLNFVDEVWWREVCADLHSVVVIEDHASRGGLSDTLLAALSNLGLLRDLTFRQIAPQGLPACGTAAEVLAYHGLDSDAIAALALSLESLNFKNA